MWLPGQGLEPGSEHVAQISNQRFTLNNSGSNCRSKRLVHVTLSEGHEHSTTWHLKQLRGGHLPQMPV